jgi:hypothetical protein
MEELFAPEAVAYRDAFVALLRRGLDEPRLRVIATLRADFQPQAVAHPVLRSLLKRGRTYPVGAPGPLALARMISRPLEAVGLACDPALANRLVQEAEGQSGGLALLGAALEDLYAVGAATGGLTLAQYEQALGGLAGILERRAERGFAVLADECGLERAAAEDLTRRVFAELVAIDPHSGEATRRRVALEHWRDDADARALIEVFSRTPRSREDNVRLLVCGAEEGEATVELAHEALLREWAPLADWIDQHRETLVRRDEVLRDAARWDARGRPDYLLPRPKLAAEVRGWLAAAGLWENLRRDQRVADFLAQDNKENLTRSADLLSSMAGKNEFSPMIFVSYAREDGELVDVICEKLISYGFRIWRDKEQLLPGMRWAAVIEKEMEEADFLLLCLSKNSVKRKRFQHWEIKKAASEALKMPSDSIYVIPVRLDECDIPHEFRDIHYFDLFLENNIDKVIHAVLAELKRKTGLV